MVYQIAFKEIESYHKKMVKQIKRLGSFLRSMIRQKLIKLLVKVRSIKTLKRSTGLNI